MKYSKNHPRKKNEKFTSEIHIIYSAIMSTSNTIQGVADELIDIFCVIPSKYLNRDNLRNDIMLYLDRIEQETRGIDTENNMKLVIERYSDDIERLLKNTLNRPTDSTMNFQEELDVFFGRHLGFDIPISDEECKEMKREQPKDDSPTFNPR